MSTAPHVDAHHDQAHVLATTGPHTGTLPLIDLEAGVQGEMIWRGAADWGLSGVGAVGQVPISGGPGADIAWGDAGGVSFADFHHYAELAGGGTTYTPTAQTMSTLWMQKNVVGDDALNIEFFDGSGWIETLGSPRATFEDVFIGGVALNQDTDQSLRIVNDFGSAKKISLTGVSWS